MALYEYQAATPQGEVKTGTVPASSEAEAITRVQAMNLIPISAAPAAAGVTAGLGKKRTRRKRLNQDDITLLTRQLAILIDAGLSLDRSMQIISEVSGQPALVELVESIRESVRGGDTLSAALREHPQLFSSFYISFIQSAELSGAMAESLEDLARYMEKSKALREQLQSALIYPAILVLVALLSITIIMVFVLPEFASMFEDMDAELPATTAFVMGLADGVQNYGLYLLGGFVGLYFYFRSRSGDEAWRAKWDRRMLSIGVFGELTRQTEMARLSRSLGTLLKGGVPLLTALGIARESLQNRVMANAVREVSGSLEEGSGLAEPLLQTGVFPEFALQMIRVGEETGKLDQMLIRVADICDDEVATATQRMLSVLEPLLIITLGIAIGGIIMSILVAIMSISEIPM